MRNLFALIGFVVTVWWVGTELIAQMPPDNRLAVQRSLAQAGNDLGYAAASIRTYLQSQAAELRKIPVSVGDSGSGLMRAGMWSIRVEGNMNGQTITNAGSRCVTPVDVQNLMSGNGGGLLEFPGGSGCGVQQSLQGNQLVGSGQCSFNGMSLLISSVIAFNNTVHFSAHMEETANSQLPFHMSANFEGSRLGDCQ